MYLYVTVDLCCMTDLWQRLTRDAVVCFQACVGHSSHCHECVMMTPEYVHCPIAGNIAFLNKYLRLGGLNLRFKSDYNTSNVWAKNPNTA